MGLTDQLAVAKPLRQRVIDWGEVFTPPHLVNDMLNLPGVAEECRRLDAKFLEPACGDGNFLGEVLRRRLETVNRKHAKNALIPWERDALLGLANLYGIQACRDRLHDIFAGAYTSRFPKKARLEVLGAARHLVRCNIHYGDALAMTTIGDKVLPSQPLVFTEWSMLPGGRFKRRRFEYREMAGDPPGAKPSLFTGDIEPLFDELGKPVFVVKPIGDLPFVHYLKLAQEPLH